MSITDNLNAHNWADVQKEIYQNGYALVENVMGSNTCKELIEGFQDSNRYRKTVDMERYRFGSGTYKYFKYPLPEAISEIRGFVYPKLVPVANTWTKISRKMLFFHKVWQPCVNNAWIKDSDWPHH